MSSERCTAHRRCGSTVARASSITCARLRRRCGSGAAHPGDAEPIDVVHREDGYARLAQHLGLGRIDVAKADVRQLPLVDAPTFWKPVRSADAEPALRREGGMEGTARSPLEARGCVVEPAHQVSSRHAVVVAGGRARGRVGISVRIDPKDGYIRVHRLDASDACSGHTVVATNSQDKFTGGSGGGRRILDLVETGVRAELVQIGRGK
eukprot:6354674-Prymnesium_polylepis.2